VEGLLIRKDFSPYTAVHRPVDTIMRYMPLGFLCTLIAIFVIAMIYAKGYERGPGAVEGARLAVLVGIFAVCAFAGHNFVILNLGGKLALELAASNFVQWILVCVVIGLIYKPASTIALAALLPEVEKGNDVEQEHAEADEARDDAEPREYERALIVAGRRRGDSKDEVESPEYFCEKVDHGALRRCEAMARVQYDIGPTSFSTSAVSTITMASHGQPSRKQPSGPLLRHFLQPMHRIGSIWMRPNGGLSSSGTQNMQSSTGQYSTQAGEPAQPVQHSVMTASSFGFFLRAVEIPLERGSNFCSSGTIPGALTTTCSGAMRELYLCFQCFGTHVQRV
jgi:predicted permease